MMKVNNFLQSHTKELQFCQPEIFSQYLSIFRRLHIEQFLLEIHGQLIEGSGLVQILTESKFSMTGLFAVKDVNSIKGARYTLQITLCELFIKLLEAVSVSEIDLSQHDWLTQMLKDNTSIL